MPLTFPSSPINGAVSGEYTYDATKGAWRKNAAYPVSVTHSDVAPSNPRVGDQWWKSNEGTLFTYYNDGTSSQWVESTNVVANVEPNPIPAGAMMAWASNTIPANWLLCDGTAVSRSTYASLFAIIGTQYGSGDGTTTFNLPNIKGRTIVGRDASQTEFDTLGELGGAKTHTLTTSEMPSHTHTGTTSTNGNHSHGGILTTYSNTTSGNSGINRDLAGSYNPISGYAGDHNHTFTTDATGSGSAHNNLQPYIVLNYIIKFSAGETPGDSQLAVRVGAVEAANNATPLSQNYIINGALDFWQRSTSGTQTANSGGWPSADRFRVVTVGATAPAITLARSTDVPASIGVQYSAAMSWSSNISGGDVLMHYAIENGKYLFAGKTVTVSFYAKAATAIQSKFDFDQDYGETFFNLTTSWARYSYTITLPSTYATSRPAAAAANDNVELRFIRFTSVSSASNTIYFTGLQVEEGSYATPFRRSSLSLQAELAACQRYFVSMTPTNNLGDVTYAMATSTTELNGAVRFPVTMRAAPAMSVSSANVLRQHRPGVSISESTATGIVANSSSPNGAQIYTTGSGFSYGVPYAIQWTTTTGYVWFTADI